VIELMGEECSFFAQRAKHGLTAIDKLAEVGF
jgi:hypothetical protein